MSRSVCHPSLRGHVLLSTRSFERSLLCTLALLLAAPLLADPPAPAPHPTMVLQVGSSGDITKLAYSPDGQTLAIEGGGDHGVWLWDVASGQLKAILPTGPPTGAAGFFNGLAGNFAFSPDGKILATNGQLWDVASG